MPGVGRRDDAGMAAGARDHRGGLRFGTGERWAWISALAYGVVNVMLRAAAPHIDPWLGALLRLLPMALVAWLVVAWQGFHELRPADRRFLGWRLIGGLVLGGAVSYVIGNVLFFVALANGGLAIAANAVQGGSVWGGILLGVLILREVPRRQQVLGGLLIAAGLALIGWSQVGVPGQLWFEGLVLAAAAGACYATANVFMRRVQRQRPALVPALACSVAGGAIPLLLLAVVRTAIDRPGLLSGLQASDVAAVLLAGCANIVALVGIAQAVRHSTVATTNTIGSAQVVFSLLASVAIFGEALPPALLLGAVVIVGGILLGQAAGQRPRRAPGGDAMSNRQGGARIAGS